MANYKIRQWLLPYSDGRTFGNMKARTVVIHNTAMDASAQNEAKYVHSGVGGVTYHYAVDDKEAIQLLPLNKSGWHAGDGGEKDGGRYGIAIEICYSKSGGSRYEKAEDNAAHLAAKILKQEGLSLSALSKHQDWSGKFCPHRILSKSNGWDNFKKKVASYYNKSEEGRKDYTAQEFIDLLAPLAVGDYKKSGILPSVTIAQGMVESANGNSELAKNAHNYFGIKASPPWTGEVYEKKTQEWVNGKYITVTAKFRKYKSIEESVKDHGAFFRSAPFREVLYKPVYTAKDWVTAVNALTGTYATSPTYAKTLTSRIVDYQLARFDKVEEKPDVEQKFKPVHIAVFAENSADMGSAMRIVSQVQNAVWVDVSRLNPDLYKEVVQVGGSKHEKASVHLQGANRYETDRKVTEWINKEK